MESRVLPPASVAASQVLDGFFLPQLDSSELAALEWTTRPAGGTRLRMPVATPALVELVATRLLTAQRESLAERPVMEIAEVLGRAVSRWYDPDYPRRRLAEELLPDITGYAPEMVRRGLKRYLKTFRHDRLLRFLAQDFENPLVLDGFQPDRAGGRCRAYGPRLIAQVFAGNVPGLPAWNLICGLLVKSATLGKSATDEPLFPVLLAASVAEEDPALGRCLAILNWPGGDEEVEAAAFAHADAVTATGGVRAVESISRRVPVGVPFIPYGHKVSFGVIGHEALALNRYADTARRAALDVSQYDQQGCLSPHVLFVESGGAVDPRTFSAALAAEMERFERDRPRASIALEESAAIERVRSDYEFRAYEEAESLQLGGRARALRHRPHLRHRANAATGRRLAPRRPRKPGRTGPLGRPRRGSRGRPRTLRPRVDRTPALERCQVRTHLGATPARCSVRVRSCVTASPS